MQQAELKVVTRSCGSNPETRKLRASGYVPANIYGPGVKNLACAFAEKEIRKVYNNDFSANMILNLVSDDASLNGKKVLVKSFERDPLRWNLIHADLYQIDFKRPMMVDVPVRYKGTPEGVKNSGGILQVIRRTVQIRALPADIPEFIEVDISALELGQSLHLGEVTFSEKITVLDSKKYAMVAVVEAEKEEVVVAAAPVAGEGAAAAAGTTAAAAGEPAKAAEPAKS